MYPFFFASQLKALGYSGTANDMWMAYLTDAEVAPGQIDERTFAWLGDQGQTEATLTERWMGFLGGTGPINERLSKWTIPEIEPEEE